MSECRMTTRKIAAMMMIMPTSTASSFAYRVFSTSGLHAGGLRIAELVADAAHREDDLRPRLVFFDLGAQAVDVAVHVVLVALVAVPPDGIEQLQPRIDAARIAQEVQEQVELLGGERNR